MVFSQPQFLFYFLPLVLLAYHLAPVSSRNLLLVVVSVVFYAWSSSDALWILGVSIALNYLSGCALSSAVSSGRARTAMFIATGTITLNLLLLAYFKYANFAVSQIDLALQSRGAPAIEWTTVALPVGISFYTFHSMSYIIDIRRQRTAAFTNPVQYALYIVFFPQLIAGPIIRFHQIASQIRERTSRLEDIGRGGLRFCLGLAKKTLIADRVGEIATAVFAAAPSQLDTPTAWLGVLAFTFQLYFDFSGYSDMAIGMGRMFGFEFPENFLRPYSATSITDFWRRWHVTLSAWFRDYLYIPLGGSQRGTARSYANLIIVFLATGLWHGASWTFVVWGAYHGTLLIVERLTGLRTTTEAVSRAALRRAVTFTLVVLGWVIFRANDLGHAASLYQTMFAFHTGPVSDTIQAAFTHRNTLTLAAAATVILFPRDFFTGTWLVHGDGRTAAVARSALLAAAFPLSLLATVASDFHPFLYFRF
jgi:alginate O-acetyltransferase complex protein AlgI